MQRPPPGAGDAGTRADPLRGPPHGPVRGAALPPFGGVGSLPRWGESELGRTRPARGGTGPPASLTGWRPSRGQPVRETPRPARGGGRHPHGSDSPSEPSLANSPAIREARFASTKLCFGQKVANKFRDFYCETLFWTISKGTVFPLQGAPYLCGSKTVRLRHSLTLPTREGSYRVRSPHGSHISREGGLTYIPIYMGE